MQTEAQRYLRPSSQTSLICSQVDSCLSRVWSQWARIFSVSMVILPFRIGFRPYGRRSVLFPLPQIGPPHEVVQGNVKKVSNNN